MNVGVTALIHYNRNPGKSMLRIAYGAKENDVLKYGALSEKVNEAFSKAATPGAYLVMSPALIT
jgi:hypothetical protein